MKPKKFHLSFRELDYLIDIYSVNLTENEKVLNLKAKESIDLLFKTSQVLEKLKPIHDKILLLNLSQNEINNKTECIKYNEGKVEELLSALENDIALPRCKRNEMADLYRQNTYKIAESIDSSLCIFQQVLDQIQESTQVNNHSSSDIEKVAQILQIYLQQLEEIEIYTQKLKDHLNEVEFYKNQCFRTFKMELK